MSLQNEYKNKTTITNTNMTDSSSDQLISNNSNNNNGSNSSINSSSNSEGNINDDINQLIYNQIEHKTETMNMLNVLRKNRQLCDVIIQIDDNNNDIYCHQIILACNSKLFMELFLNYELSNNNSTSPKSASPTNELDQQQQQLQQGQHQNLRKTSSSSSSTAINNSHNIGKATNANKQIIIQIKNHLNYKINEYTYGALKCCIQYMYTSQLRIANINLIKEVYCLAHSLSFQSIVDICSKHLIKHLNETNCLSIRCFARDEDLIQSSSLLIQTNIEKLLTTKQFTNLSGVNIELIGVKNKLTSKFNLNINAFTNGNCNGNIKGSNQSSSSLLFNGNNHKTTKNDNSSLYDLEFNPIILDELILKWLLTKRYSDLNDTCDNINMLYLNDDKSLHDCCDMEETDKNYCDYIHDYQQKRVKNQHHYQQQLSQTSAPDVNNTKLPKFASFQITDSELNEFYDEYEPSSISNNHHSQQLLHDNEIICTSKINDTNFITICIINGRLLRLSIHLQPLAASSTEGLTNDINNLNNESETYKNSQQQSEHQQQQQNDTNLLFSDNSVILKSRSNSSIGNHEDMHFDPSELVRSHSEVSTDSISNNYIKKMISARASHGVIPYNKKLFIIAGYDRGECLSKCELYDPATNSTQQFSALNNKRGRAACIWFDKTKSIYVFGGSDGHHELYSLERYDFNSETNKWTTIPFDIQFECTNIPACSDDDFIYFVGIKDSNNLQSHCLRYDPIGNGFSRISDMNAGRSQCALVRHNDLLYVFGGHDQIRCLNTCEVYNVKENKWNCIESMIKARRSCGAAVKNGLIFLVGGTNGSVSLKSTEIYDIASNKFSIGPELNVARANVSVAFIGDMLYAVGGFDGKKFLNTIERLNINDINAGWSIYYSNNES